MAILMSESDATIKPLYKRVIGIDVHSNKLVACCLSEHEPGQAVTEMAEFGGFRRDRKALAEWVKQRNAELVVMESTGVYWKAPYTALEQVGIEATVVNARHVHNVPGRKTDILDAQWLAMVGRLGLLKNSFIPPADIRELRLLTRRRQAVVSQIASEKNRVHKTLSDAGVRLNEVVSDIQGKSAMAMIRGLIEGKSPNEVITLASSRLKAKPSEIEESLHGDLTSAHRFVLQKMLDHIDTLENEITELETLILASVKADMVIVNLLQTIPGVDRIAAAMILAEIGRDMTVFKSADHFASWAGLCPGNHESAGKRKSGKTRHGNGYLRRILCECAHAARRTQCAFKNFFNSLVARRGFKRALIATAHKLLRTIFFIIGRKQQYRDLSVNVTEIAKQKYQPRWFKFAQHLNKPAATTASA